MDKTVLLDIASDAIKESLTKTKLISREKLVEIYPWLEEKGAVFVTLNEFGHLRGCIGSIIAHRPLIDDVIHNAKAAAFDDPRFYSVEESELDKLDIEISLLTPPQEVFYENKESLRKIIRPGVDGVIIKLGNYQATYLPSVWEQVSDFDSFFGSLCQKAGLSGDCLDSHPVVYRYQAEKITR
ncbi:MAG: AmmeMemoRadiSam system protein A [Campylobacterales bacterium]|nr:AmmeMemoRadiSam system protein A [Campylobacterales bacterium]